MYSHKWEDARQPKATLANFCDALGVQNCRVLSPVVSSVSKPQRRRVTNEYLPWRQKVQNSEGTVW